MVALCVSTSIGQKKIRRSYSLHRGILRKSVDFTIWNPAKKQFQLIARSTNNNNFSLLAKMNHFPFLPSWSRGVARTKVSGVR